MIVSARLFGVCTNVSRPEEKVALLASIRYVTGRPASFQNRESRREGLSFSVPEHTPFDDIDDIDGDRRYS